MGLFFGTDGIRGVVNDTLTFDVSFRCGNSVGKSKANPFIIIGGDTRTTRSYISSAFCGGAMAAGSKIIDIGVCPTAGIAYITTKLNADYGVVISASHNPAEFNGIKVFGSDGFKLGDRKEEQLERNFLNQINKSSMEVGSCKQNTKLIKLYEDHLVDCCKTNLKGLTILLDGSYGAAGKIAPAVFRRLGAKVIATHCQNNGANINNKCGSTCPTTLSKLVKKYRTDMGFAFDGDADRIIACDSFGNIIDGDMIIYMLGKYLKTQNKLNQNIIVGTRHTNMGIEKSLNKSGIQLIRTDIGDKYVSSKIEELYLSIGGEKSGHVILREYATTGDGILTGIKLAEMVKQTGKSLKELNDAEFYSQYNIDCTVNDKMRIINNEQLANVINEQEKELGSDARIMVRISGTEPKIRIMCECLNETEAENSARKIADIVYKIDALQ